MILKDMAPGTRARFDISIREGISLPLWLIRGGRAGPSLAVTAGVHGCEFPGIEAVRRLYDIIEPAELSGSLILMPTANPGGFYGGLRYFTEPGGRNLNRSFPGEAGGDLAGELALAIEKHVFSQADFVLDMHSGDIHEELTPLVFFPKAASEEVNAASLAAARALPLTYRLGSVSKNGLYGHAAQTGIPALLAEIGGAGYWDEKDVALAHACIFALMGHMGIRGSAAPNPAQLEALESLYISAEDRGLWYPRVRAGQSFVKGQVLGELRALEGGLIQRVEAPFDGTVWYYTRTLGVSRGDDLIAFGRV